MKAKTLDELEQDITSALRECLKDVLGRSIADGLQVRGILAAFDEAATEARTRVLNALKAAERNAERAQETLGGFAGCSNDIAGLDARTRALERRVANLDDPTGRSAVREPR